MNGKSQRGEKSRESHSRQGRFRPKKYWQSHEVIPFRATELESPGVLVVGKTLNVAEFGEDYNEAFLAADGIERPVEMAAVKHRSTSPLVDERRMDCNLRL